MFVTATLLGALGMWLMLPRRGFQKRRWGALLAVVSLGLFAAQVPPLGATLDRTVFDVLALVTLVSAVCTVTFRSPVYSAVWFGLTLLGTSGLFLFQGAQFLSMATITIYAGAILVTFLFVLMLSDPRGRAYYDRLSWEAMLSASAGAVMVGVLTMTLSKVFSPDAAGPPVPVKPGSAAAAASPGETPTAALPAPPSAQALEANVLSAQHVARLGGELFGRHLLAVEAAGALLFVALLGATAMMAQGKIERFQRSHHGDG